MWLRLTLPALLLITPLFAFGAGFATESLFLSKSPAVEGETVFIHTVVTNDSDADFTGEVIFTDGEAQVGTVAVTLLPGGAEAVSVSWQPTAGSHRITAELTAEDGTVTESESSTFNVERAPETDAEPTASDSASVESSEKIKETVASISPEVASAATPVFSTIDSLRQKSVDALKKGEVWAEQKSEKEEGTEGSGIANTIMKVVATLLLYLIALLTWLVSNAGIFYPVLAIAFLYFLWRLYKRMRR